ncbi:hypothetical protein niasHT_026719 [Heterodera trifolii]|uniref:Uncharacterized protein n=1 Tax=Heterodera trifolii TaxID=157864 RepID=A0ABD2JNN1_9BILA
MHLFISTNLKISFLIEFLKFSHGQLSSDLRFHLTNGTDGVKSIKFRATEQCPENIGTVEATKKAYGIEFRLPKDGGNCDQGLLICYPALLQRGTHLNAFVNFKLKRAFAIGNKEENPITSECAKMMASNGNENGTIHWHGIKLRTVPMPTNNSTVFDNQLSHSAFMMEASIAPNYHFHIGENQRHFSILFNGNRIGEPLIENAPFSSGARAMQNDFLANLRQNGVTFLADYTALWLLGLDMVPMMNKGQEQQEMKLFISRSSNCTMEAWFIQPTVFPINFINIGEQQQMISIKALTEPKFDNILVELLNVKKDGSTKTELSFTIGTDTDLEVDYSPLMKIGATGSCKNDDTNYPSSSKSLQHEGVRLPRDGIYVLNLDIVLTKHCYALKLGGTLLDGPKCPTAGGQLPLEAISRLKVQGKISLLVEPLVQQIDHGTTELLPSAAKEFKSRFKNIDADFWMEIGNECPAGTQLIMLSMTSRESFEKRSCARETWMKEAVPAEVRRFFVADPSDGEADIVQEELDAEQKKHGDMVFLHGFVDKYMHLHFKWHGALIWQQRHCAGAEWVAKVDDDTVVDLRRMAFWINKEFRQIAIDHPLVFFGDASGRRVPFRNMRIKWQ